MSEMSALIMRCGQCGAKNRVPIEKKARCGKCGEALDPNPWLSGRPQSIVDADFERAVLGAPIPALLDCWAPWCQPCLQLAPELDRLAQTQRGRLQVYKLNVDENRGVASRLGVQGIPALFLFEGGQLRERLVGAMPMAAIQAKVAPWLY